MVNHCFHCRMEICQSFFSQPLSYSVTFLLLIYIYIYIEHLKLFLIKHFYCCLSCWAAICNFFLWRWINKINSFYFLFYEILLNLHTSTSRLRCTVWSIRPLKCVCVWLLVTVGVIGNRSSCLSHASLIVPWPALSCQLQPASASENQRRRTGKSKQLQGARARKQTIILCVCERERRWLQLAAEVPLLSSCLRTL